MTAAIRLSCALACIGLTGLAARSSIADAVLARGDDAARSGRLAAAERYYDRAEAIGGARTETLERYALLALLAPRGASLSAAMHAADGFVGQNPTSVVGHFDRGLIEWRQRAYLAAAFDFRIAAVAGDDRARAFAAASLRRVSRRER